MPIDVQAELRKVSQATFARVAYKAMAVFFSVYNEMGKLFREQIYKTEVAYRHGRIENEVPVDVRFDRFCKRYWIDMIVCDCAIFEVKACRCLAPKHRSQAMNYLLLSGLPRGKLVNLGPDSIEHEFVNALTSYKDRTQFVVNDGRWQPLSTADVYWKEWFVAAVRDWGTGLDLSLYVDALVDVLGGLDCVEREVDVVSGDRLIGAQQVLLAGPGSMLKVTMLRGELNSMEYHLRRFLQHARLEAIQWVNITQGQLTFCTLRGEV